MSNELTDRAYYYENEKSKKKQTIINYAEYYSITRIINTLLN